MNDKMTPSAVAASPVGSDADILSVTDKAKTELLRLATQPGSFLRIWVEAGGCSGMKYQAVIDDTAGPFDLTVFDDGELRIVTDQQSKFHVEGIHIDYSDDLVQAGFRFLNPRASSSCGCGQSFQE